MLVEKRKDNRILKWCKEFNQRNLVVKYDK